MHSISTHPRDMSDMTIHLTTAAEAELQQPRMYNRENKVGPTLLDCTEMISTKNTKAEATKLVVESIPNRV